MAKKRRGIAQNHHLKIVQEVRETAEKEKVKRDKRLEKRRKDKEELMRKLGVSLSGLGSKGAEAPSEPGASTSGGDVAMTPADSKKRGVIRKIGKKKEKALVKAALRAAKSRGEQIEMDPAKVRRLLLGKQKGKFRPDGKERTRDKAIRKKREQRERRMGKNQSEDEATDYENDQ
mmetsp:Transcript_71001/g.154298  ORF Transcript_71001/g.154298 Transcript_71001/m.154298 type:complete len:175 (-) Transcript_71001:82-606(-)